MADIAQYRGTGKRKTSVARVILRPGDGSTWINGRTLEDYFPRATHRTLALAPFSTAGAEGCTRCAELVVRVVEDPVSVIALGAEIGLTVSVVVCGHRMGARVAVAEIDLVPSAILV